MSQIIKTPNLGLTKYTGITYPLFLGDFGDNMEIIDGLIKSINDDIADIQRVIDTVSTQNIDDLIARIMALEVKVDNNANIISGLLKSLNGLSNELGKTNNRISAIVSELEAAMSDIDNLKQCCDNVLSTLTAHGERITQNETAITNINNEIVRMKENIIGNAQDITTLATQIATILESKQDKLTAGTGISIDGNVISAVLDTVQITVIANTTKADANKVAWACVDALKDIRYDLVGLPIYSIQNKENSRIHTFTLRARRLVGDGDVL